MSLCGRAVPHDVDVFFVLAASTAQADASTVNDLAKTAQREWLVLSCRTGKLGGQDKCLLLSLLLLFLMLACCLFTV